MAFAWNVEQGALDEPLPGTIAHYEVLGELGRGGMGVVYRARDTQVGREVAIKVLLGAKQDEQHHQRFLREAEVTAQLADPGIVKVHEVGVHEGSPFIVYELIQGARTFEEVAPELDLLRRCELVRDVARALGVAHAGGIVHRDVKPKNVVVDAFGDARLLDFGVAKALDLEALTRTGHMVGTPYAMAPEQIAGRREISPAADVWALGVLLYWSLTGVQPFDGTNLAELMARIHSANAPPPSEHEPKVSPALDRVFVKACSPHPDDRYPDGHAFAAAVEEALAQPSPKGLSTLALVGGLIAVLIAGAAGLSVAGVLRSSPSESEPRPPTSPATPEVAVSCRPPLLQVSAPASVGQPNVPLAVIVRSAAPWVDVSCGRTTLRLVPGELGAEGELVVEAKPGTNRFRVEAVDPAGQQAHAVTVEVDLEPWPDWYTKLPKPLRAPAPLPEGVRFGVRPGEYVNAKDRSILVWIPMGELTDGPTVSHARFPDGFFIGRYEVSWEQFLAFCEDTGRPAPKNVIHKGDRTYEADRRQGVFNVSWHDAQAYCAWANLRLPKNREWEYAAAVSYNEGARLRLCVDMDGKNREWVFDAAGSKRVLRGSSHKHAIVDAAFTGRRAPSSRADDLGFRVLRSGR